MNAEIYPEILEIALQITANNPKLVATYLDCDDEALEELFDLINKEANPKDGDDYISTFKEKFKKNMA